MNSVGQDSAFSSLASLVLTPSAALDDVQEGVVISDPHRADNPIVYVNPSFLAMTGYMRDEILGKNCRFLQGADTDKASVAKIRTALQESAPVTVELLNYRKDGSPFWNHLTVSPVKDASGAVCNFIAIQRDVTAYRRLRDELAEKKSSEEALRQSVALLKQRIREQEDAIASFIMQS